MYAGFFFPILHHSHQSIQYILPYFSNEKSPSFFVWSRASGVFWTDSFAAVVSLLAYLLVLFHSRMTAVIHTPTPTHIYLEGCFLLTLCVVAFYYFLWDFFSFVFLMETVIMWSGKGFSSVCVSYTIHQTHPKSHRVLHGSYKKSHAIEPIFERGILMRESDADRKVVLCCCFFGNELWCS